MEDVMNVRCVRKRNGGICFGRGVNQKEEGNESKEGEWEIVLGNDGTGGSDEGVDIDDDEIDVKKWRWSESKDCSIR